MKHSEQLFSSCAIGSTDERCLVLTEKAASSEKPPQTQEASEVRLEDLSRQIAQLRKGTRILSFTFEARYQLAFDIELLHSVMLVPSRQCTHPKAARASTRMHGQIAASLGIKALLSLQHLQQLESQQSCL